ncbi:hypothetical protein [Aquibacillus saliphilus]|uniref:hypothetical protein n=1 Tax=Aquibacillus saliphilus TaxID=1909422 RepID=UPI001CEFF7DA|nr:hypothetical protein [Aquibacillus saliphilus]
MVRQLKVMLYFFLTDLRTSFIIFWTVLSSIVVLSIIAAVLLTGVENGKMYLTISFAIYIYCAIFGFIVVKESLSFSLKMGATRKNYFFAVGILFLSLSILMAILENIYHSLIIAITELLGISNFNLIHLSAMMVNGESVFYRFGIDVFIMFFMFTTMFLLGLIFHKYGLIGGYGVLGLVGMAIILSVGSGLLVELIQFMINNPSFNYYSFTFLIGVILYLLSWLLLHNISAKSFSGS